LSDFILAGIPPQDTGSASGLQSTMTQAGSAVGVAALGAVFFEYLGDNVGFPGSLQRVLYLDALVFAVTAVLVFLIPARRPINADQPH
jgi:predicted MFS family arabinose efflux permease